MAAALGVTRFLPLATIRIDFESLDPQWSSTDVKVAEALPASSHLPYMTISVSVRKSKISNTIASSCKKRSLAIATVTAVAKEKHFKNVENAAKSSHLSLEAAASLEALLKAIWTVRIVFTKKFQNLHETDELESSEDPNASVEQLLCRPL